MRRLPVAQLVFLVLVILAGLGLFLVLSHQTPVLVAPPEKAETRP